MFSSMSALVLMGVCSLLFHFLNEFIDVHLRVQNSIVRLSVLKKHTPQPKSGLCYALQCVECHAGLMGWPQYSCIWSVIWEQDGTKKLGLVGALEAVVYCLGAFSFSFFYGLFLPLNKSLFFFSSFPYAEWGGWATAWVSWMQAIKMNYSAARQWHYRQTWRATFEPRKATTDKQET